MNPSDVIAVKDHLPISTSDIIAAIALFISLITFTFNVLQRIRPTKIKIRSYFIASLGISFDFEFTNPSTVPCSITNIEIMLKDKWVPCVEWPHKAFGYRETHTSGYHTDLEITSTALPININPYTSNSVVIFFNFKRDYPDMRPKTREDLLLYSSGESQDEARFRVTIGTRKRIVNLRIPSATFVDRAINSPIFS